jgi:hypothetical protein
MGDDFDQFFVSDTREEIVPRFRKGSVGRERQQSVVIALRCRHDALVSKFEFSGKIMYRKRWFRSRDGVKDVDGN